MGQSVLKADEKTLAKMQDYYKNQFDPTLPPGSVFRAKTTHCAITAYKSGKVLFQGKEAELEASIWSKQSKPQPAKSGKASPTKKRTVEAHAYLPPDAITNRSIIGSDEVGTGDFFGPMTVAACYVTPSYYPYLKEIGVQDSKNLNDRQIVTIAQKVIQELPYSLLILSNEKYNNLRAKGITQIGMKARLHQEAQMKVHDKLTDEPLDGYLVDQFATPDLYFKSLGAYRKTFDDPIYFKTKGESVHLSVAAASIIARYAFVREMDRLSEMCGMDLPKGAGSHVDLAGAKLIQKKGIDFLGSVAKLHFSNAERAIQLAKKTK